ncbi:MAG: hypothetical protein QXI58_08085, partial [Candidatus Micrarchaeia archaeon]
MAKKYGHILEMPLASKIYFVILTKYKKEAISGYKIAKEVYGTRSLTPPAKVYSTIKAFNKLNLIYVKKKERGIMGVIRITPNLFEFLKVLNDRRMPENYKLTEEELKILAEWL